MWLETDRILALSLLHLENDTCSGCGNLRSESMDIDNFDSFDTKLVTCAGCATRDRKWRSLQSKHGDNPEHFDGKSLVAFIPESEVSDG